jgi:thiol-disulfide isomerase/thioredoxin
MSRHFFAITLFAALFAVNSGVAASDFTDHFVFTKPPAPVPAFTFQDAKGQVLDLKNNFRGHYVLLNLWATWCGPCVHEMPALDALAAKLAAESGTSSPAKPVTISTGQAGATSSPPLEIVALTEDHDGLGAAESFYKRHNLHHLTVFVDDSGEATFILRVQGLPTTLLIDPQGREIGRIEGATDWDDPATIAFLKSLLKPVTK